MILSDKDIREGVNSGKLIIEPFDESCLQPATYDLHLDNEFKVFKKNNNILLDPKNPVSDMMEDIHIKDDECFIIHPGDFVLGLIKEKTGVDNCHVGRLEGKSSLGRLGLIIHTTSGFLDPGNRLKLTLELFNASTLPIKLYPNMKIAQIAFERLTSECERPYNTEGLNSKYYDSEKIDESKIYLNFKDKDKEGNA